jgi:putative transposase
MATYFITACAHMHQNLFQQDEVAKLMVATFLKYRDAGEFKLHEYVVMPDHIHVLLSLNDEQKLSRAMQLIKGGFSHALRENGIVMREVWQQRYHDRRVRDDSEFVEMAEYIRQNPVRRGLVERAEQYPYSSVSVAGLKPRINRENAVDANLKVRSTDPSGGREEESVIDASLRVRSTDPSHGEDLGAGFCSTVPFDGEGAGAAIHPANHVKGVAM